MPDQDPNPNDPALPPEILPQPSETGPREPIGIPSPAPDTIDDPMTPEPLGIPGDSPSDIPEIGPDIIPSDAPGVFVF